MADGLVDVDCWWEVSRKWSIVDCICEMYCFNDHEAVYSICRDGTSPRWKTDGCWRVLDNDGSIPLRYHGHGLDSIF